MSNSDNVILGASNLDSDLRSSHEQNMREAFDAMRAYHVSELSHKRDAVAIFKTVLGMSVASYAGIVGGMLTPGLQVEKDLAIAVTWVTVVVIAMICWIVARPHNRKIYHDHLIYERFGTEYTRACEILGLTKALRNGSEAIVVKQLNPARPIGSGHGYKKTQDIITGTAVSIFLLAVLLATVTTVIITG